jgi:hypothetical protein
VRFRPESPREILRELPWLAGAMAGLAVALFFEHFFVHKQIVLPALEITVEPPLWMWGAMFVPELVWFFAAGWRLRSWSAVLVYAGAGATLRQAFDYLLVRFGEPGHVTLVRDPYSDLVVRWPAIVVAYVLVLGLAFWSKRHEGSLVAGA